MVKVYQRIIDPGKGDCLKCAVATLFQDEYENVPHFIEHEKWFSMLMEYVNSKGYEYHGQLYNKKWSMLQTPLSGCFEPDKWAEELILNEENMKGNQDINGLYLASVNSPKYYSHAKTVTHAVLCDKDFNIIFDPNPAYENILKYPMADLLDYNGINYVWKFEKKK